MRGAGFEVRLQVLLFILADQKLVEYSAKDARALMEGDRKKTFGQIFSTLKRYIQFDMEQQRQILQALEQRNFFIHDFYHARAERLASAAGRAEEIRSLKAMRKQFKEADAIMHSMIRPLFLHFYHKDIEDISRDAIDHLVSNA